ncbi:MAG: helix-turn-helix transcriptional regulator [Oscillospiraceae bacterium]|nr:helix-turn-helix transcriptional regulator [Oscillospiraceae bacterium]
MDRFLRRVGAPLSALWKRGEGIRLTGVRPGRLVYVLAYVFELMLYAVRETFLPFLFLPEGPWRLAFGIAAMAGLGGAVTCARCGYAFAANNAERLVGIAAMTGAVAGIYLLDALHVTGRFPAQILPVLLLGALIACLLCFREGDLEAKKTSDRGDAKGLYWALAFMIGYFSVDGYVYKLVDTDNAGGYLAFCAGVAAAALILLAAFVWLRLNVWHLWTVFLMLAVGMAVLAMLAPSLGTAVPYHLFGGLAILGWPLSLYMLACAQRRFASYRLLKQCTVIFVVLSPLTTISDDLVAAYRPGAVPAAALVCILTVLFLFLLTLPLSYRRLFSAGWIGELHRDDMGAAGPRAGREDPFAPYGLTPRQREVARLLLEAKTRRQISGELGLSESTVKTHTSELYKKLGINSRAELFRLFGVADGGGPEED